MGIHINGDHNSVNVVHGDVIYGGDSRTPKAPIGFFGMIFFGMVFVSLIVKFWYIALIVVSLSALAFVYWLEKQDKDRAEAERRHREAALSYRAEDQNSAYLRGEPWGVYGNFPPPSVATEVTPQRREQ
jgi:uncharacterized membrane protein